MLKVGRNAQERRGGKKYLDPFNRNAPERNQKDNFHPCKCEPCLFQSECNRFSVRLVNTQMTFRIFLVMRLFYCYHQASALIVRRELTLLTGKSWLHQNFAA